MKIPTKKLNNGFELPVLWFGTWLMWWDTKRNPENDDSRDISAIKYAIERWLTCIDTAEMYAEWYCETLVWEAIKNTPQEELFLSSKVSGNNCSYDGIKNACKQTLARLWVEYIDLYYIHWRDTTFSLKESMRAMNELVDEGYIRYIGVSNFSLESLKQAQEYSHYPVVANQVHYNLRCREAEISGLIDYCAHNDVMIVAWRPFEYWNFLTKENKNLFETLQKKYNASAFHIALQWLISQKNIVTLFKSTDTQHIRHNIESLWLELSEKDHDMLTKSFHWQISVSDAVPLT